MSDMEGRANIPGFNRRTVLKSAAVAAVGVSAFSGTASATNPKQINFCGCSQVCVAREGPEEEKGGTFDVVLAREDGDDWEFEFIKEPVDEDGNNLSKSDFCYEIEEDSDWKVIAVRPTGSAFCGGVSENLYCNPGRCARNALRAYRDACDRADCVTDGFGTFPDPKGGEVTIVQGRCGKAGRTPPGRDRRE